MNKVSTPNESKHNSLLLVTSKFDLDHLVKITEKNNPTIITFDYESHRSLRDKNIAHQTSDSFLDAETIKQIQELSYMFSKWYDSTEIATIITYEKINLGKLFYVEFHYFLLPFLKKICELSILDKSFPDSEFIVSPDLYGIAKSIHKSTHSAQDTTYDDVFLYDSLTINLTDSLKIKISKKQYQRIKSFSELWFTKLMSKNPMLETDKKYLLVEFDPIKYGDFLINSKEHAIRFILFNRRRPAVWNLKSLNILRKSNCVVPSESDLFNNSKYDVTETHHLVENMLEMLLKKEDFLKSFFIINGFSFWLILRPIFIKLCRDRFSQAIKEIKIANTLFKTHLFSGILVWSESGFNEQIVIGVAKNHDISVFLLQHGLFIDEIESLNYNKFSGIVPILSDKFIVWGDVLVKYSSICGIPDNKIEPVGSVVYDRLFWKKKSKNDGFVLLALTAPRKVNISGLLNNTIENYENAIKSICKTVLKNHKKLIVKLHPFHEELDITKLIKEIDPSIRVISSGDMISLLESCDLFLSMGISTAILEAQIIGKPIISIIADYDFGEPYVLRTKSCLVTTLDNFEENFVRIMHDDSLKQKIILSGQQSVRDNFTNCGTASKKLLCLLENFA